MSCTCNLGQKDVKDFLFLYLFNITVTIKIMRYSVCVEGVLNETRTVTNQGENPEVLNQKEEDIEDNKKIIAKLTITDKLGNKDLACSHQKFFI